MGVGAAGTWALGAIGVLDFIGGSPLNYGLLPKKNDP